MAEFRNIIADGDLIRQVQLPRWWLFGDKHWAPHRNLSREVRSLEQRMHKAHAVYKESQEDFVVAQKNVGMDINMLRAHKSGNSEVSYEIPSDESILVRKEGIKYSGGGNQQPQKQKGQQNGNGNNQQNNQQKSGDQQNNQAKQKGQQRKPASLMELLMNTKVVTH